LVGDGPVLDIAALPFAEESYAALPAPRRQALQQALDETVRDSTRMPGVTAAVLSPGGAWTGAAGVDGAGTPLVPEAMTDIGSVTRTVTAAEVLLLADQHRLDLDAPASTYLDHPLLASGPTVRQLFSHTSGIPTSSPRTCSTPSTATRPDPGRPGRPCSTPPTRRVRPGRRSCRTATATTCCSACSSSG
jgi:CubicO group peptidase (beta-lactamase class C family)